MEDGTIEWVSTSDYIHLAWTANKRISALEKAGVGGDQPPASGTAVSRAQLDEALAAVGTTRARVVEGKTVAPEVDHRKAASRLIAAATADDAEYAAQKALEAAAKRVGKNAVEIKEAWATFLWIEEDSKECWYNVLVEFWVDALWCNRIESA